MNPKKKLLWSLWVGLEPDRHHLEWLLRPRYTHFFPSTSVPRAVPRGSYPTPYLGYLVLWLGSPI